MKNTIEQFISLKKIAIIGISHKQTKFANTAFIELKKKNYKLIPIHKEIKEFENQPCYTSLKNIPEHIDGIFICISPSKVLPVLAEANSLNIKNIWLQQGAESDESIDFCKKNNINLVSGKCILMFAKPVSFPHSLHRFILKIFKKLY